MLLVFLVDGDEFTVFADMCPLSGPERLTLPLQCFSVYPPGDTFRILPLNKVSYSVSHHSHKSGKLNIGNGIVLIKFHPMGGDNVQLNDLLTFA